MKIVKRNQRKQATYESHASRRKGIKYMPRSQDDDNDSVAEIDSDRKDTSQQEDSSIEVGDDSGNADEQQELGEGEDEFEIHKRDLLALKEQDPEFYQYLQENDRELLEFSEDDKMNSEHLETTSKEVQEPNTPILTIEKVRKLELTVKATHSLNVLKRLLVTFRLACHSNDERDSPSEFSHIESDTVYQHIFSSVVYTVGQELVYHLNIQEDLSHVKL